MDESDVVPQTNLLLALGHKGHLVVGLCVLALGVGLGHLPPLQILIGWGSDCLLLFRLLQYQGGREVDEDGDSNLLLNTPDMIMCI